MPKLASPMKAHKYSLSIYNGRVKIKIDGITFLSFDQLNFLGYYAFKDDHLLYGIDIIMKGDVKIETSYKTKEVWTQILKLLDKEL